MFSSTEEDNGNMKKIQGFIIYRIWYGDILVYLGRTKQPLQSRIHGHLFKKPMHRSISINLNGLTVKVIGAYVDFYVTDQPDSMMPFFIV